MSKQDKYIMPTDEEEEAINAAIAADPDDFESDFENAFRSTATTPQGIAADVMRQYRGKQKAATKQSTTMRLPVEVIDFFKAGSQDGKGWQTRLNQVLIAHVASHKPR